MTTYDTETVRAELELIVSTSEAQAAITAADRDTDVLDDDDQKRADREAEQMQADREDALVDNALSIVAEARAALARLDAGTYGTCVDCGKDIEPARLQARPEAGRCLVDQEKAEAAA